MAVWVFSALAILGTENLGRVTSPFSRYILERSCEVNTVAVKGLLPLCLLFGACPRKRELFSGPWHVTFYQVMDVVAESMLSRGEVSRTR
jgi:hypothetical protein